MKTQIKLGAIIGYITMAINIVITLAYMPLMLRLMGQAEYGLYSLVVSVVTYLTVLDLGFGNAMIRFVSKSQAQKDNKEPVLNGMFLLLYLIIGVIAFVIGMIIYANASKIFGASLSVEEVAKARILLIISLTNVSLSFPLKVFEAYTTVNEKFVFIKILALIRTVLTPLTMTPLLFMGYKAVTMTIVTTVVNIGCQLVMMMYCFTKLKMKIKFGIKKFDTKLFKEIAVYSFFIFLNIIVDHVFNTTDQIILGIACGTIAVSVYAIAHQIIQMNLQCSTIVSGMFLPKITKLLEEKNSDKKISDLFIKVSRIQMYIMLLVLSGFFIFGKSFIGLWAGEEYIQAYYIVLIIITPSIVPLTQNLGLSVIQARNRHQFRSVVYIIIAILNVLISIPLAIKYQGIGAAIGSALANICGQIITMNIFYYKKMYLDIPKYWKFFIKLALQVGILSSITYFVTAKISMNFFIMIVCAGIYTMLYLMVIFANMNDEERDTIYKFIGKFFKKTIKA